MDTNLLYVPEGGRGSGRTTKQLERIFDVAQAKKAHLFFIHAEDTNAYIVRLASAVLARKAIGHIFVRSRDLIEFAHGGKVQIMKQYVGTGRDYRLIGVPRENIMLDHNLIEQMRQGIG